MLTLRLDMRYVITLDSVLSQVKSLGWGLILYSLEISSAFIINIPYKLVQIYEKQRGAAHLRSIMLVFLLLTDNKFRGYA